MKKLLSALWIGLALCGLSPMSVHAEEEIGPPVKSFNVDKLEKAKAPESGAASEIQNVPELSAADQENVRRAEKYLNGIHTLSAKFMQTTASGEVLAGIIYMSRPGKMRLEYQGENKNLLIADGAFVHVWDDQAKTSSSIPLGSSLADMLLRDPLQLSGDIRVVGVKQHPAQLEISLVQRGNPNAGTLTLEFEDRPFRLLNWRIEDGQGLETRVALSDMREGADIPASTFYYHPPVTDRHK